MLQARPVTQSLAIAENKHVIHLWIHSWHDSESVYMFNDLAMLSESMMTGADNLMLQVVPPRIWFPLMQIIWGILTFW